MKPCVKAPSSDGEEEEEEEEWSIGHKIQSVDMMLCIVSLLAKPQIPYIIDNPTLP